ncbi:uncharacterized protein A1O9_08490 [Exophiala aquamarina CBS 119918]|uniref:T6SS Phospholipase effector Tle1-like catalytic domain-containing protein n=1 Tax=Exophiala aquamarina CBS 119918 TaxID=1182545 RepID=A0A072PJR1_9EURO|nr:uncharacterized protein A1O9_08490 [Exophiala aquamarina CBS 119918]KEF55740.1 hypothetical protein A1O9_08490 [Exophiala aquamarina CBS 119918]
METSHRWRRHTYPAQSSETEPCTSPPAKEGLTSVQLPAKIPALKDAEKLQNHGPTIVVCLDGTRDKFDGDNSNIVHLVSCLKKDDKYQNTYYQAGIGDEICISGFSRGAYTARCLARMVHKVGLLPKRNVAQIPFAYDFYKDDSPKGREDSAQVKKTFCTNVSIYFLGLFDSVASVGFIPRELPFSTTARAKCHYVRHAMALDERRAKFKLCRFEGADFVSPEDLRGSTTSTLTERLRPEQANGSAHKHEALNGGPVKPHMMKGNIQAGMKASELAHGRHHKPQRPAKTDLLEVWFANCHCDVGGGAVRNEERHRLSNIPLRWMIR